MEEFNNKYTQQSVFISNKTIENAGLINEFLWICSGVNRKVLRQCPTEYAKYTGIGGTILFTSLMAMLSGGYALYTVFNNYFSACLFGIFWGLLIFNLDRFMVNTMYSDGKHTISKEEFWGGLPRIILAIFLGIVISAPIEMKIFDDKIQAQLLIDQANVGDEVRNANESLFTELAKLQTEKNDLEISLYHKSNTYSKRRIDKENELSSTNEDLIMELSGKGPTGKVGEGRASRILREQIKRLELELSELKDQEKKEESNVKQEKERIKQEIAEKNRQIKNVNDQISVIQNKGTKAKEALQGFTARLKAMSEVTDYREDPMLFMARIMIMLLFIAIEVIPTLFKMMMTDGPYEDLLRAEKHRIKILADKRISEINDAVNTEIMISVEKNKERIAAELQANKIVLEKLAAAQSSLLEEAIERWRAEEYEKIKKNPSAYIQTNQGQPKNGTQT